MLEGKAMIKKLFSDENGKKSGLKLVAARDSCPKDRSAKHKASSWWKLTAPQRLQNSLVQ
jgi:hypothetical protein